MVPHSLTKCMGHRVCKKVLLLLQPSSAASNRFFQFVKFLFQGKTVKLFEILIRINTIQDDNCLYRWFFMSMYTTMGNKRQHAVIIGKILAYDLG